MQITNKILLSPFTLNNIINIGNMCFIDNKTILGVFGVLPTLFAVIGSVLSILNQQYLILILLTISVIVGVILMAWAYNN